MSEDNKLHKIRHSAEHVLTMAMNRIYGDKIIMAMGPATKEGFYFDFSSKVDISEDDFAKIEKEMKKIVNEDLKFKKEGISYDQAREMFKNNKFKQEWIDEISQKEEKATVYHTGSEFVDLCSGPHVESTSDIGFFKLLSVAGAYWRGDEKREMLTRIYGTSFETEKELNDYLEKLEKAKQNDHRILGQKLDLFAFSDLVGKGLVMYTPKGTIIKEELKKAVIEACSEFSALEVSIPHMAKRALYETSGHAEKFEQELFVVKSHYKEEFILKPVNCPHHTQIYASRPRSYRDLPISYIESTQQHRDEKPGSIGGLNRTRSFEIDDGHTFCTVDQIEREVGNLVRAIEKFYKGLGMWGEHWVSLSFRDKNHPEKYIGDENDWQKAEKILLKINKDLKLNGKAMEGEAALYGPKIDIMLKDALGNDRQLGTVQIDFAMPQRFKLTYTDKDGTEKTPVMIHRAILGSYGRFIAYLLESTGGAFPVWLSPVQVEIMPITEKQNDYAQKIFKTFKDKKIRVELNDKNETLSNKIRNAQIMKTPYMIIVGAKEVEANKISVRTREGKDLGQVELDIFIKNIEDIIKTKSLNLQ